MSKRKFNGDQELTRGPKRVQSTLEYPVYCEPFLRQCETEAKFRDLNIDVKGLTEYPSKAVCEEKCRLPGVIDGLLLNTIGDLDLFSILPHGAAHKRAEYAQNKEIDEAVKILQQFRDSLLTGGIYGPKPEERNEAAKQIEVIGSHKDIPVWDVWPIVHALWWCMRFFSDDILSGVYNVDVVIVDILNRLVATSGYSPNDWVAQYLTYASGIPMPFIVDRSVPYVERWFSATFKDVPFPHESTSTNPEIKNAIPKLFSPSYFNEFKRVISGKLNFINCRFTHFGVAWFRHLQFLPESVLRMIVEYALRQPLLPFPFNAVSEIVPNWREWEPNPFAGVIPGQKLGALSFNDFQRQRMHAKMSFNEWIYQQRAFSLAHLLAPVAALNNAADAVPAAAAAQGNRNGGYHNPHPYPWTLLGVKF